MPDIGEGKSYAVGFWESQICDNSLAKFPSGIDFSWGILELEIDGADNDNFVDLKIIHTDTFAVLQTIRFTSNGKKKIDISQYSNISATQDIKIRIELSSWV